MVVSVLAAVNVNSAVFWDVTPRTCRRQAPTFRKNLLHSCQTQNGSLIYSGSGVTQEYLGVRKLHK